jgi:hypothetical protein
MLVAVYTHQEAILGTHDVPNQRHYCAHNRHPARELSTSEDELSTWSNTNIVRDL